jgi:caffeoyl-CoA O-methyltransferase
MKPKLITGAAAFMLIFIVLGSVLKVQQKDDVFSGIEDEKVLPLLRHLPRQHGGMNVPAVDGRFLYDLIIEKGYTRGLEIGTSNGYSGLWIGLAMKKNRGSLVSLEINPLAADEARANFVKAGLDGVIEVRTADALEAIPDVPGNFDFIFIDAWKPDYPRYLELVRNRVERGGAITAHNVISSARSMRDFLDAIQNDPGLETEIHRVSGQGISVSIVRAGQSGPAM